IVYDLVRSHDGLTDAAGEGDSSRGGANRAASELSSAFREHLFCADGSLGDGSRVNPQAVALGIEALNFLRGRQVSAFLRHHQGKRTRTGTGSGGGGGSTDGEPDVPPSSRWLEWAGKGREKDGGSGLPFGYYLDLDALSVARAAARCGAQCSALFYAEAWIEGKFGESAGITASRWRDQGEGSGGDGLDDWGLGPEEDAVGLMSGGGGGVGGGGGGGGRAGDREGAGGEEKREVERLLLEVFSSLPEPDSIYGVPAPAADLSAQATVYAHEGGWESTLPAYDTLLQQQQQPSSLSLGGLGGGVSAAAAMPAGDLLVGRVGSLPGNGLQTGVAASLQRMGLRHVLEHYLRGLRVGPGSLGGLPDLDGDLRDMQFESKWRMCEWDPGLATLADRPSSHSAGSVSRPWGPALGGGSSLFDCAGGAAGGGGAAGDGGPGDGSSSSSGRPVFHEHVFQALGSLRQRNARVFESAVGNARALALARLGSGGGGQEGGKGLYPCLVQLQCVVEMEEMFSVLSGAGVDGGNNGGGDATDDAAEALMERWRKRSAPVQEHFESLEPALALREAMVRVLHQERPGRGSRRLVLRHLLDVCESARRVGHHSIAQAALHRFLQVSRAGPRRGVGLPRPDERAAEAMRCRLAEARVSWGKGETDAALRAARAVATRLRGGVGGGGRGRGMAAAEPTVVVVAVDGREREEQRILSEALRLTGAWVSKTRSESSREILESYLNPAVEAALAGGGASLSALSCGGGKDEDIDADGDGEGGGGGEGWGGEGARRLLCAAHFTLAEYLAGLYASVRGRVESPEWVAAGRVADSRARELASCLKRVS
ncbi:unnamed protein product, partial [Laminaria digitata]